MAKLPNQFNANEHDSMTDFSALPAGEYTAHVKESQMKLTKSKQGQYLELVFAVDTPGFVGRQAWSRLNLINSNTSAVEIANQELKSICDATGIQNLTDSDQLHGKPLIIKLKVNPANAQWGESNSIVAYKSIGKSANGATPIPAQAPPMETPENAPSASKPDWA